MSLGQVKTYQITCDGCGKKAKPSDEELGAYVNAMNEGFRMRNDEHLNFQDFCPTCVKERKLNVY